MTVYELIQQLNKCPANCDVRIVVEGLNNDIGDYLNDSKQSGSEETDLFAEPLCVHQKWNTTVVYLSGRLDLL